MFVVTVNESTCTGCGECVAACPAQVFELEGDKAVVTENECMGCESCVAICPSESITLDEY